MITTSFYAPSKFARYVQLLVMKYNGRFVFNPYEAYGGNSRFEISFDDENSDIRFAQFQACVHILTQPWM